MVVQAIADVEDHLPRRQRRAAAVAGQTAVQRPHSVQVNASSTCFQVRSASEATPTRPSAGGSSAATGAAGTWVIASGRSGLRGGSLAKNRFGIAVMMWKCLDSGSRHRKTRTVTLCSHHPTSLTVSAVDGLRPSSAAAASARQRREVALVAVDVVGDQPTGVVEQPADHDQQDEDEDQDALPVRGVAVALLGAAETEQARAWSDQPPVEHVEDADDHDRLEQVAGEEERRAERLVGPRTRGCSSPRRTSARTA